VGVPWDRSPSIAETTVNHEYRYATIGLIIGGVVVLEGVAMILLNISGAIDLTIHVKDNEVKINTAVVGIVVAFRWRGDHLLHEAAGLVRQKEMNEVGDLVLGIDGQWMVRPPERCANGHPLAGRCIVATQPCRCQDRHVSWCCDQCGHITFGPPLGVDCDPLNGPARVR
jgi:hypothetical protein